MIYDLLTAGQRARFHKSYVKEGDCFIWQGPFNTQGYAVFNYGQKRVAAAKVWLTLPEGEVKDLELHRTCKDCRCVNPDHLKVGKPFENVDYSVRPSRGKSIEDDLILKVKALLFKGLTHKQVADALKIPLRKTYYIGNI